MSRLRELAARSRFPSSVIVATPMPAWQRRAIDEQIRRTLRGTELARDIDEGMRKIGHLVRLARTDLRRMFWTLDQRQAEDRRRALAMQRWARRRGRRKGRA